MRGGSYAIVLSLAQDVRTRIGALGSCRLDKGRYVYIGSARKGIKARVERHRRCARLKRGPFRWHIDYLLNDEEVSCVDSFAFPDIDECVVSRTVADLPGARVPVRGFGSSDCVNGCRAHLYLLPGRDFEAFTQWAARIGVQSRGDGTGP